MGAGIAITRGSAAAMSLSFAILLLTVCRNVITRLRETFLYHYIPFDSALALHKIVAMTGAFFALVHSVGHVINFYHVSTQPISHLKCLFKEISFPPTPPSFAFWVYKTLTGRCAASISLLDQTDDVLLGACRADRCPLGHCPLRHVCLCLVAAHPSACLPLLLANPSLRLRPLLHPLHPPWLAASHWGKASH